MTMCYDHRYEPAPWYVNDAYMRCSPAIGVHDIQCRCPRLEPPMTLWNGVWPPQIVAAIRAHARGERS